MIFAGFCKESLFLPGMLKNKNIKILINYFLGPLLFLWLSFSIYSQIRNQPHLEASWLHIKQSLDSPRIVYLLLIILLMFVNWGLEALKWKISVEMVHPVKFKQAFKAILSGVSFSVTMPNRVGDYFGRILYLPEGKRLKVISLTLVGSISQLLVTLAAGTIGLVLLKSTLINDGLLDAISWRFAFVGMLTASLLLALFYYNLSSFEKLIEQWFKKSRYLYLVEAIKAFSFSRLNRILAFSGLRYLIFILQYILAFRLFEVNVPMFTLVAVMTLVFAALAIIPSIVLLELGIRGQVSLKLIGLFTANSLGILFTSLTIWFINLVIPAIAGSLLMLSVKVFKKRNEIH
jgi:hypothetical protein